MKNTNYRRFQIEKSAFALHTTYGLTDRYQITGIHPYDETEYHWAWRTSDDTVWHICRDGKRVGSFSPACPAAEELEAVARELLNRDAAAHLTRTGGIW